MLDSKKFNSILIKHFPENSNDTTGTVYHYTSPSAFLNIFQSQRIRFTDILFLNDKSEKFFFIKKLIEFCEKKKGVYPKFNEAVGSLLQENKFEDLKSLKIYDVKFNEETIIPYKQDRTFVFCASKNCDSLNMWNYYIHNGDYQGYSIGINAYKLLKTFDTDICKQADSFVVLYGDVLYDEKRQFAEIDDFAQQIEKSFRDNDILSVRTAMLRIRAYIDLQGVFYKSPKFKHEEEFRIVVSIENDRIPRSKEDGMRYIEKNNQYLIEGFDVNQGFIVPYLSVVFPKDCVSSVYTAPIMEYAMAKEGVKEFLDFCGYRNDNKSISVYHSNVPVRF